MAECHWKHRKDEHPDYDSIDKTAAVLSLISTTLMIISLIVVSMNTELLSHPKQMLYYTILLDTIYMYNSQKFYQVCNKENVN